MPLHRGGMVAQSVEHLPEEQSVVGTTPTHPAIFSLEESKRFWKNKDYQIYLTRSGRDLLVYDTRLVEETNIKVNVVVDSTNRNI